MAGSDDSKASMAKPVFAVIALIVAIAILFWYFRAPPSVSDLVKLWFYDLSANKLVRAGDHIAPTKSTSGATVVRAYIFSCGECGDAGQRYIGWLEQFNEEAKAALQKSFQKTTYTGPSGLETLNDEDIAAVIPAGSRQIRLPDSGNWVDFVSVDGVAIREKAMKRCGENPPNPCDLADFAP